MHVHLTYLQAKSISARYYICNHRKDYLAHFNYVLCALLIKKKKKNYVLCALKSKNTCCDRNT